MNSNFKINNHGRSKLAESKQSTRHHSTFPFGKCKVCTDQATGVHYGIPTCEGCKGFFKRSILRNEYYRCFFGNSCILSPRTRNRCKACRFKQCIAAGMSLTGIKMGRIPKAVKEQALNKVKTNDSQTGSNSMNVEDDFDYDTLSRNENDEEEEEEEEEDCVILNEKIDDEVIKTTQTELKDTHFSKQSENDDLFFVIKQMSSNTKPATSNKYNYHHVYDINHTDDCLAQFLESIDMYTHGSPHQCCNDMSPSPLIDHSPLDCSSSVQSNEQPIRASNIEIKSNFLDIYMQMTHETQEPSYKIICSLLNDKIYQIYHESTEKINLDLDETIRLLETGDMSQFHNATLEEIWSGLIEFVPLMVKLIISFVKEIPGLNELSPKDFTTLINNRMYDAFVIMNSLFFINGECYIRLSNNAHYSRYWMSKVKGKKKVDAVFEFVEQLNALKLTTREKSLLLPLLITMHDENVDDLATLHVLNEYYTRAILYEFDLSKRDNSFIIDLAKLISKFKQCKSSLGFKPNL